jgi:hypothetical protein
MIRPPAKYLGKLIFLLCASATTTTFALDAGCNDLTSKQVLIPAGSTVDVLLMSEEPNGSAGAMVDAINLVSGKINGITFNLNAAQFNSEHAQIKVYIGGASGGDGGEFVGRVLYNNGIPYGDGGELTVYSDVAVCGTDGKSKCLNPSQPNYYNAMVGTFVHEFLHALGSNHSAKDNIMYPAATGINALGSRNWALDCIFPKMNSLTNYTCT